MYNFLSRASDYYMAKYIVYCITFTLFLCEREYARTWRQTKSIKIFWDIKSFRNVFARVFLNINLI